MRKTIPCVVGVVQILDITLHRAARHHTRLHMSRNRSGWRVDRSLARPLVSPGRVVATDRAMPAFDVSGVANLELLEHDIAAESLPPATFDFVHARLVLMHLPEPAMAGVAREWCRRCGQGAG